MSGSDLAAVITASVGVFGAAGTAISFVWTKVEKRFGAIETELEKCRERESKGLSRRSVQLTVIELLWQEVERLAPNGSRVLKRAKNLLDGLKEQQAEEEEEDEA